MRFSGAASAVFRVLGDRRCKRVFVIHGGLTPPALGNPAMRTFTGETATCAIHERSFTRAATVSPPWYGNRTRSTERLLPNEDAHMPRGAYAPRSCIGVRMSAGEIAIFAMHKRTSAGAANRQPAVVRESHRQHRAFLVERGCSHASVGLRPPLLVVLRCGHSPAKLRLVRHTNARLQERRTVSPPWLGNRTCNGDRFS
jgi:hypothetical protein